MLTKKHRSDADRKFGNPAEHFGALDANSAQRLALAAGDMAARIEAVRRSSAPFGVLMSRSRCASGS